VAVTILSKTRANRFQGQRCQTTVKRALYRLSDGVVRRCYGESHDFSCPKRRGQESVLDKSEQIGGHSIPIMEPATREFDPRSAWKCYLVLRL
jgi:hypothetical protein